MSLKKHFQKIYWLEIYFLIFLRFFIVSILYIFFSSHFPSSFLGTKHSLTVPSMPIFFIRCTDYLNDSHGDIAFGSIKQNHHSFIVLNIKIII